ncbi:SDR family oxidoreductase [Nodosilinea sp. LEGE 07088]|uniref:SDR family oxidoreductase n=1 Tax=Nodosilinea sp. LEGE 07088 TaxID=2777968 RepID=UPI001882761F|nr:SDR family oxidoreductase [Nodosilinea sp. LEGE 07088]MBE9138225.1 SDR family oxidoreductase [Nodosilinea sp. LEGE 07088]
MILITGATGNIGSALVQQFATAGIPAKALVRSPEKAKQITAPNIETIVGDLAQPEEMRTALQGVKKLFLLSSLDPQIPQLQQQVIQSAQKAGVEHVVKLSVEGADPQSSLSVNRWHGEVEQYLEASGLTWTFLRPTYFMQNLLMSASTIREQSCLFATGDTLTVAIDARDIAAVALKVLTRGGHEQKRYHLTGAEVLSFSQMLQQLGEVLGREVKLIQLSPADYRQGMISAGIPDWLVNCLTEMGNAPAQVPVIEDTVSMITGRSPILFQQFAADYAEQFR